MTGKLFFSDSPFTHLLSGMEWRMELCGVTMARVYGGPCREGWSLQGRMILAGKDGTLQLTKCIAPDRQGKGNMSCSETAAMAESLSSDELGSL